MCIGAFFVNEDQHQRGYYLEKDQTCNKCPAGANCSLSGVDLHGLQSLESFWRPNKDDNTFYPCPYDGDCVGSYIVNSTSDQCAPGHHGTLCAVCLPKHVRVAGRCELCVGGDSSDGFLVIAGIIMFLFGMVLFKHMTKSARFSNALHRSRSRAILRKKKSKKTTEEHIENLMTTGEGMSATVQLYSSFRILIGFVQINAALNLGFDIPWPTNFLDFIEISSIVNINFDKILAPLSPCALEMRFIPSMYSHMTTLPVILVEVAGIAGLVLYLRTRKTKWGKYLHAHIHPIDLLQRATRVALFVIFLMLPGLGTRIFRTFHCVKVGEDEWLSSDFKIRCWVDNEGHKVASIWAGVFMLFYVIGIPAGSVAILYRFRTQLNDPKIKAALGSLYISYKPQFWWFESVVMAQKMTLAGGLVLVGGGSSRQVVIGICVSMIHLCVLLAYRPYKDSSDAVLALIAALSTLLSLQIGLVLRMDEETQEFYPETLGYILIFINLLTVLTGIYMMLSTLPQFYSTANKMRETLRHNKMMMQIPIFAHLPRIGRKALVQRMSHSKYSPGKILMKEGEHADVFFVLVTGKVDVMKNDKVVKTIEAITSFGETSLTLELHHANFYSATIRANTKCHTLELHHHEFIDLYNDEYIDKKTVGKIASRRIGFKLIDGLRIKRRITASKKSSADTIAQAQSAWGKDPAGEEYDTETRIQIQSTKVLPAAKA